MIPEAFDENALFGRRALALAQLRMGGAGYMKCCQGSGAVEADRVRQSLKRPERLEAWGLPKGAQVVGVQTPQGSKQQGSCRISYRGSDGGMSGFQGGEMKIRAGAVARPLGTPEISTAVNILSSEYRNRRCKEPNGTELKKNKN